MFKYVVIINSNFILSGLAENKQIDKKGFA